MSISAVVRVIPGERASPDSDEPTPERLQATVWALQQLGFSRVSALSYGVSFTGQPGDFKRAFGVQLHEGQVFGREIRPSGALAGLVDRLEVAPPPMMCM